MLRVADLASGDESERPLDLGYTRRAAVAYGNFAGRWPDQRLAVVELADSTVVQDELLGDDVTCPAGGGSDGFPHDVDARSYRSMTMDDLDTPSTTPPSGTSPSADVPRGGRGGVGGGR
jgi:hypothetical protein